MKQIEFTFPLTKEQAEAKKQRFVSLKQNELMQNWLKRYHQEESFLYEHSVKMTALANRYQICGECGGLRCV